ncbi:MAG: alkaline phosphatase family protein [Spirochaetales bacterium]|nr:alkaline phosphatase family protein [Spirochaetales bacterium]
MTDLSGTSDTPIAPLFGQGLLRRPDGANSVHLFRALSLLCGYTSFPDNPYVTRLYEAIGEYSHYVFILIDGMGTSLKGFLPPGGCLSRAQQEVITSVYPSTTAVALTSQATGLWPAEHGITGWHTYLPERDITVLPLKATERFSRKPLQHFGIPFREVVKPSSVIPDYPCEKRVFVKKPIRRGQFAKWAFFGITRTGTRSFSQSFDRLRHHVRGAAGPWFSHLYIDDLDSLSHRHGSKNERVRSLIDIIDENICRLRDAAGEQVRIIVSADHGHVDIDPQRHHLLREGDPVLDLLFAPPSGESRNPIFHVRPGREDQFAELFAARYADDFILADPDDIETEKLMGPVSFTDVTKARLGSFVGIAKTPAAIEYVPANGESKRHKGMHGGLSRKEIEIPLFVL